MITKSDINPRYLFVLDMYGTTDKFVKNFNALNDDPNYDMEICNEDDTFFSFMLGVFVWWKTPERKEYWKTIATQDESKLLPLPSEIEEANL